MRNFVVVVCSLVFCITLSAAQEKISSQWKCEGKPADQHAIAVGDREGHSYTIAHGKCTAEKGSLGDVKEQEGTFTEFGDVTGNAIQNHGVFVETVAGGDKIFYHYHGSQTAKDGKFETGDSLPLQVAPASSKKSKAKATAKARAVPTALPPLGLAKARTPPPSSLQILQTVVESLHPRAAFFPVRGWPKTTTPGETEPPQHCKSLWS
jgi:hypothetical protein